MKVSVENKSRVKDVRFHYPWLMNSEAKDSIIEEYYGILQLEDDLDKARLYVRELEKKLKEAKDEFSAKDTLFTIEFEEKEVEHVDRTEVTLSVVNPTDASRKTYTGS